MPEMPTGWRRMSRASRGRNFPSKPSITICVSRLIAAGIPDVSGGTDVPFDFELALHESDTTAGLFARNRDQPGERPAAPANQHTTGGQMIEQAQNLLPEVGYV